MPTLWTIPEKWKAVLVMVAKIVASLHLITSALVRIFDNNELSLAEAVEFGQDTVPSVVGKWRGVNSDEESGS